MLHYGCQTDKIEKMKLLLTIDDKRQCESSYLNFLYFPSLFSHFTELLWTWSRDKLYASLRDVTYYALSFFNCLQDNYDVNHSCRGHAVIINYTWKNTPDERTGSENDVDALQKLFARLHFKVMVEDDLEYEVKHKGLNNCMKCQNTLYRQW